MRLNNILFVNDGSPAALTAAQAARALGVRHGAELTAVAVAEAQDPDTALATATSLAARPAELLVTCSHGRGGMDKLLHGSLAEQLFRHARCPVLLFGPHAMPSTPGCEYHRILLATDFSAEAAAATKTAFRLAREYQAELLLLHVVAGPVSDARTEWSQAEQKLGAWIREEGEGLWRQPKLLLECGAPATTILDKAREYQADLIVLGARQLDPEATQTPWTTAYQVLCASVAPVLAVPASPPLA